MPDPTSPSDVSQTVIVVLFALLCRFDAFLSIVILFFAGITFQTGHCKTVIVSFFTKVKFYSYFRKYNTLTILNRQIQLTLYQLHIMQ